MPTNVHEYEFFPNGKLVQRAIDIKNSNVVWIDWLRGYLNKSRNTLIVLKNQRNDTIFGRAELLKRDTKRKHLLNDTILRIDEHFMIKPGEFSFVIVDYRRVK
jgi:hypothetical protein